MKVDPRVLYVAALIDFFEVVQDAYDGGEDIALAISELMERDDMRELYGVCIDQRNLQVFGVTGKPS